MTAFNVFCGLMVVVHALYGAWTMGRLAKCLEARTWAPDQVWAEELAADLDCDCMAYEESVEEAMDNTIRIVHDGPHATVSTLGALNARSREVLDGDIDSDCEKLTEELALVEELVELGDINFGSPAHFILLNLSKECLVGIWEAQVLAA
jgi:hypothetical protein